MGHVISRDNFRSKICRGLSAKKRNALQSFYLIIEQRSSSSEDNGMIGWLSNERSFSIDFILLLKRLLNCGIFTSSVSTFVQARHVTT